MSRHQKRIAAPRSWPVPKKTHVWVAKPNPGPHSHDQAVPLGIFIRDMLKLTDNMRETKRVLNEGNILVDGIQRKDYKFPVGIFDVVQLPRNKTSYRMLMNPKGKLMVNELDVATPKKPCKILNKTIVKDGKVQLNLHDGSNIIASNDFKVNDTVIITIPERSIDKHISYEPGNLAIITGGSHSGELARIKEINKVRSSRPNTVVLEKEDGSQFETIEDYVFVVGINEPEINLGGAVSE